MDRSKKPILDEFGKVLMSQVRDRACEDLQRIISGKAADKSGRELYERFRSLSPEDAKFVQRFLVIALDLGMACFLHFLDDYQIEVLFRSDGKEKHDVRAISDGLHGEIWTEDGWIERFSAFKDRIDPIQ